MNTRELANPECPRCHGKGKIYEGAGPLDSKICLCVLLAHHNQVAATVVRSELPKRAQDMTFAAFQTGGLAQNDLALRAAHNFVENYSRAKDKGWVIGFWGQPSAGKTHLAYAIAIAVIQRYLAATVVWNVPTLFRQEKKTWRPDDPDAPARSPIDRAINADLLVLDDLGAEYNRPATDSAAVSWVNEVLYMILDARIMDKKPTLYTTNLSPDDLGRKLNNAGENVLSSGTRVWERILRSEVAPAIEVMPVEGVNRQDSVEAEILFGG
jgi:DNA replication protein DnaC